MIALFQDTIKVIFLAWAVPLHDLAFQLRLRDTLVGLALAICIALIVALFSSSLVSSEADADSETSYDWKKEAWWVGLISATGGLLPVIVSNRQADFGGYSRDTLNGRGGRRHRAGGSIKLFEVGAGADGFVFPLGGHRHTHALRQLSKCRH